MGDSATSGADSFVTRGRFSVVDLASGPSQFGNSQAGEGTVVPSTIPRKYAQMWQDAELQGRDLSLSFRASLANIVITAVKYLFAPDVQV